MGSFFSQSHRPATSAASAEPTPRAEHLLTKAGLHVLTPSDPEYAAREDSYWSNSAKIKPACIVRPANAQEVSTAVTTLVAARIPFAVRSGGHTQWAGSNNIRDGVTIDLGRLSWTRYDAASETVDIGPGGRWREVYPELRKHGRAVAGGREGNVGVAGLILGGGNTFFTPRHGFACDNVVAFEVVLADGRVVAADADTHADLFWALKGGSLNFGIVTNFRMRALPSGEIWGGLTLLPKQVTPQAAVALTEFTDAMEQDPDSNLLCFFAYTGTSSDQIVRKDGGFTRADSWCLIPQFKDLGIAVMQVQVAGVEDAPAYRTWQSLPAIVNGCKKTTVSEIVSTPEHNLPTNYHDIWFTATFKNDHRIVAKAAELHETLVDECKAVIPDGDFWTQCLFQPLPSLFGRHSAAAGGNAMGVERQVHNGLLFQAAAMVRTPEQEAFVYPKIKSWIGAVKEFASTIEDGNLDWVYLNYSDKSQDPLRSYGAENVRKLKDVAARYDPEQVFQELCPGGFKLASVQVE